MNLLRKLTTAVHLATGFFSPNALPCSRWTLLLTWLRLRYVGRTRRTHRVLGLHVETDLSGSLHYLFYEIFALQEYRFRTDSPTPLILDAGGNIGMATLFFKMLYPGAIVHTFEPGPRTFALLQANIRANHLSGVTAHNVALSDTDADMEFFTDAADSASMFASLRPERSVQWTDPAHAERVQSSVRGARLSGFIDREVDFLKLDIEGAEAAVLRDLVESGTLRRIRAMVIEYHHHITPKDDALASFLRTLEEHGFGYQLRAPLRDLTERGQFQDILIAAYRRDRHDEPARLP